MKEEDVSEQQSIDFPPPHAANHGPPVRLHSKTILQGLALVDGCGHTNLWNASSNELSVNFSVSGEIKKRRKHNHANRTLLNPNTNKELQEPSVNI
jgi:hypothetical protein